MRVAGILPRLRVAGFAPRGIEPKKPIRPEPKVDTTTKVYAARQLLALGPLSFAEFLEITGWPFKTCRRVLSYLVDDLGEVERLGRLYLMTNGKQLPDMHPLDAQEVQRQGHQEDGAAGLRAVRAGSAVGIPSSASNLRQAQAGCCGCGGCANRVEREGVSL